MAFTDLKLQRSIEEAKNEMLALGYRFERPSNTARIAYGIVGLLAVCAWLAIFMLGAWISTGDERDCLNKHGFNWDDFLHVLFYWTPTNVAWLGLLAALIAGCLSYNSDPRAIQADMMRALVRNDMPVVERLQRQMEFLYEVPWVSMKRSFAVYLLVFTSSYLLDVSPFKEPEFETEGQEKFVHLAGIVSALSFVMGYDPTRFQGLIERMGGWSSSPRFDLPPGKTATPVKPGVPPPAPQLPPEPGPMHIDPQPPGQTPPTTPVMKDIPPFKLP